MSVQEYFILIQFCHLQGGCILHNGVIFIIAVSFNAAMQDVSMTGLWTYCYVWWH